MGKSNRRAQQSSSAPTTSSSNRFDFTDQDLVGNDAIKSQILGIDGPLPFDSPCVRTHEAEGENETYIDYMRDAGLDPSHWPEHLAAWNPEILDPHRMSPGQQVVLCDPGPYGYSEEPQDLSGAIDGFLTGAVEGGVMGTTEVQDLSETVEALRTGVEIGGTMGALPIEEAPPIPQNTPRRTKPPAKRCAMTQWGMDRGGDLAEEWLGFRPLGQMLGGMAGMPLDAWCYPGEGKELPVPDPDEGKRMRESVVRGLQRGGRAIVEAPGDVWDAGGKALDGLSSGAGKAVDAFNEHLNPFY